MIEFDKKVYPVVKVVKITKERQSRRSNFYYRVYNMVRNIKRGQTMTYADVAKAADYPGAARAVGNALNKNHDPNVPCHRVIRSDGKVGGYNRGSRLKLRLLKEESTPLIMSNGKTHPNVKSNTKPK